MVGVDFVDGLFVFSGGFDYFGGGSVDYGGDIIGLSVESVFVCYCGFFVEIGVYFSLFGVLLIGC